MTTGPASLHGAGLGLRRAFVRALLDTPPAAVDFYEIAPENWIGMGGANARRLRALTERHPFVCHGLSLSLGGPAPLDLELVRAIGDFLDVHDIAVYSEHLSYCSDDGQLYDLLPIPFTEAAIDHVVARIGQVQDLLGRRIAVENVSYYAAPGQEMTELDFIGAVLERADCELLLDVNNIHVNAVNHGYDALDFLRALPGERIRYGHVAGHRVVSPELCIDTHGSAVIDPVWSLLAAAYEHFGVFPTLLERDFDIPPLAQLVEEVEQIALIQRRALPEQRAHG
ncbi:DUF692 domain-containing protein [Marichromatium gracile]|uniref:UPF0276 protein AY586_15375 n=1 Tax=Marichromatium gracile TaxID=1048 RepID=A0ABR5VE44_MARGR|nr:DUF692 domain-containing protein [Marichromatium gracile]KXX63939.1 hypothetical protein AY586_15375 [Marichromatium gracile]